MKIFISKTFQDLRFCISVLDSGAEFVDCEEGILIVEENVDGLDEVCVFLINKYQPGKSLKELKRIRSSLEQQPVEKSLLTLISFYNHFKNLLNTSNLKYVKYIEDIACVVNLNYLFYYLLNIQVGQVVEANEVEGSEKLYLETVDIGKKIQIVSGVREIIPKEEFIGSKFLFITNIKPSKVMGIVSSGMILCGRDGDKVSVIKVGNGVENGTRLQLEKPNAIENDLIPQIDLKKNFFKKTFEKLCIKDGFIEFEGVKVDLKGI